MDTLQHGVPSAAEVVTFEQQADPFWAVPLLGDLSGALSRKINIQHRLVYQVLKKEKTVKIIRM
ncbi:MULTISPECIES: hypothetical protein [unclassified Endozoicomonas]